MTKARPYSSGLACRNPRGMVGDASASVAFSLPVGGVGVLAGADEFGTAIRFVVALVMGPTLLGTKFHSITSSAATSNVAGTVRPSAFAALRLMASSNLVGWRIGMSLGFAPFRIWPTMSAML